MDHLPEPCLVVLVGPSGSGKSTWAGEHFAADEIVSSDRLRAVVGRGEDDLEASDAAFELLDAIVEQRSGRGLTTVVDTLGLDPARRQHYLDVAQRHDLPCAVVGFDTPAALCRERNRARTRPIPADALTRQLRTWSETRGRLDAEGFSIVLAPSPVRLVAAHHQVSAPLAEEQRERPVGLRFGLHLAAFPWSGEPNAIRDGLREVAVAAEAAGFESIWVMDHLRQIPQVGRDWDPMLESYTTLAWLAAVTDRVRLGALVTAISFRHPALLAKIIATLDVLSGGRAMCGLGVGWYEREMKAYGWTFPPLAERYALLEDALQVLPRFWGPGSPSFEGRSLHVEEAIGYPRPIQDHIPLLVGGGGERRTLRLAAAYADAVNVMGDAATVRHKAEVLFGHAAAASRDPATITLTHLSPTLVGRDRAHVRGLVDRLRPRRATPEQYAAQQSAGTVDDQIGRFRALADAGVRMSMVSLPDLGLDDGGVAAIERFAPIIESFRETTE